MNDFSSSELAFMLGAVVGVGGMVIAVIFAISIEAAEKWYDNRKAKRNRMIMRFAQASFDADTEKRKR